MYYKIVEKYGPQSGEKWHSYLKWRGLTLTGFDSVDNILRPDLFTPESKIDWKNCVNEDCKLSLITNIDYAKEILSRYDNAVLVGVEIELDESYVSKNRLLGYDIIDGYCAVSLITNWGSDEKGFISNDIIANGLLNDLDRALQIRDRLRQEFPEDSHAMNCGVWAIYRVEI